MTTNVPSYVASASFYSRTQHYLNFVVSIGVHNPRNRPAHAGAQSLSTLSVRFQKQARPASGRYAHIHIATQCRRPRLAASRPAMQRLPPLTLTECTSVPGQNRPCTIGLLDHPVGALKNRRGNLQIEHFRGSQIDNQLELDRPFNHQI